MIVAVSRIPYQKQKGISVGYGWQNEKQVARPAFALAKINKGIRTRREQTQSAEENSPADYFCRRGQGAKRREGAPGCAEKSLALRHKSAVVFIELRCFLLLSKDLFNDIINYNMLNFLGRILWHSNSGKCKTKIFPYS